MELQSLDRNSDAPAPVSAGDRIESLDVLRGFALLGILLLNILGFGLYSAGYFTPLVGAGENFTLNVVVWSGVNLFFEGAMRALFSMLFGAGVVMFTTGLGSMSGQGRGAGLHYKRNFWLLVFGVFDAYILLWTGDILIVYAVAGAVLYPLRNLKPRTLIILAGVLFLLTSAFNLVGSMGMSMARDAATQIEAAPDATHSSETVAAAGMWQEFSSDYGPGSESEELEKRRGDYLTVAAYSASVMKDILLFVVPVFLFWDALAMMLLGMAFYRMGILTGERSRAFYLRLMLVGFGVGLLANGYELVHALDTDFDLIVIFSYFQSTYHVGRLGMGLGWLGLVMLVCQRGALAALRARLAAVGRMALSNYLLHSLICLFLFTGAGLGLVGVLERWMLYPIVFLIWTVQLLLSPWWLERFRFGPAEWLWRSLTYGARQRFLASHLNHT